SDAIKTIFYDPVHSLLRGIVIVVDPLQIPELVVTERCCAGEIVEKGQVGRQWNGVSNAVVGIFQEQAEIIQAETNDLWTSSKLRIIDAVLLLYSVGYRVLKVKIPCDVESL